MASKFTTQQQIEEMRQAIAAAKGEQTRGGRSLTGSFVPFFRLTQKLFGLLTTAVIIILLVVLVSVVSARQQGETISILGYRLYVVETGSMSPTLEVGSVFVANSSADRRALQEGTIVTFRTKAGVVVTHRIYEVIKGESGTILYKTKGDNPINSPDPELLEPERIIAVFTAKVPWT